MFFHNLIPSACVFQLDTSSPVGLTINGKAAIVTFTDANTLSVTVPALTLGPQQITITNANGESVSLDVAIAAN